MSLQKFFGRVLSKNSLLVVIIISVVIAFSIGKSIWNMNFWPTDTEVYFLDAAIKLPTYDHLSDMHHSFDSERVKWLHGKEIFILAASYFQRLLHDRETLRPFLMVCILSICFSSILLFIIAKQVWGNAVGWICYFLFSSCFWPYLYILFAKHQPLGLFFFLLSLYLLMQVKQQRFGYWMMIPSGLSMGLGLYSSTVSVLYLPYLLAGYIWVRFSTRNQFQITIKSIVRDSSVFFLGLIVVFLYVNFPDLAYNVKSFLEYVNISKEYNHFFYNQTVLVQWLPYFDLKDMRGGWVWIVRYFFVVMPVLFPIYILSVLFLVWNNWIFWARDRGVIWMTFGMILVSLSSPVLAEIAGVAQYGANYFTSLIGILALIGYSISMGAKNPFWFDLRNMSRRWICLFMISLGFIHAVVNILIFSTDVYPTRMCTTFVSQKINEFKPKMIFTYKRHPLKSKIVDCLNPEILKDVQFIDIENILQVQQGIILLPPISKDTIFLASFSDYTEFDKDLFLNRLVRMGGLENVAIDSFKTLGSSRIWKHEEEILSYRALMLGQPQKPLNTTKVWLLDASKIQAEKQKLIPLAEDILLRNYGIRNIGSESLVDLFKGLIVQAQGPTFISGFTANIFKVGNPMDELVAYLYVLDRKEPVWIPHSVDFISQPVKGSNMTNDSTGALIRFSFKRPLLVNEGFYFVAIYRTGKPSDENFYRIYNDFLGQI